MTDKALRLGGRRPQLVACCRGTGSECASSARRRADVLTDWRAQHPLNPGRFKQFTGRAQVVAVLRLTAD